MGSILDGVATLEEAAWAAAYIAALRKQPVDAARVFASKARSLHRLMWTSEEEGLSTIIDGNNWSVEGLGFPGFTLQDEWGEETRAC